MKKGQPNQGGTISGKCVSSQPKRLKSTYCGTTSASLGSSMVASTIAKRMFLPRAFRRAKAYAAKVQETTLPMMLLMVIFSEFQVQVVKFT